MNRPRTDPRHTLTDERLGLLGASPGVITAAQAELADERGRFWAPPMVRTGGRASR